MAARRGSFCASGDDAGDAAVTVVQLAAGAADGGAGSAGLRLDLGIAVAAGEQIQQLEALLDGAQLVGRADVFKKMAALVGVLQLEDRFIKGLAAAVVQFFFHGLGSFPPCIRREKLIQSMQFPRPARRAVSLPFIILRRAPESK